MPPEYTLPSDLNQSGGVETLFTLIVSNVENFMVMFFLFIFLVLSLSGYLAQKRKTDKGDILAWFSVGSLITTILAIIASLIPPQITIFPVEYVIVCIAITITFMLWYAISQAFNES